MCYSLVLLFQFTFIHLPITSAKYHFVEQPNLYTICINLITALNVIRSKHQPTMTRFIQLTDINGTKRFINTRHLAFIEQFEDKCRVHIDLPGRDEYKSYVFLCRQSYEEAMRILSDPDY